MMPENLIELVNEIINQKTEKILNSNIMAPVFVLLKFPVSILPNVLVIIKVPED